MRRAIVLGALAVVAIVGGGCSLVGEPESIVVLTVDCATFEGRGPDDAAVTGAVGDVPVDGGLEVQLCSNPSTGFSWEEPTWEGDATLQLVTRGSAEQLDAPPGTPGQESFTFTATGAGTTIVHFVYSQPWAGGTKGAWRYDLTVTVR